MERKWISSDSSTDNAIRTNKAKIDKTQPNSRCRLCGDRDETIKHIISEYSKLTQKEYKTRHDWVGKVIQLELCKKFEFDHWNKLFMHNPESVLENETQKIFRDFEIQMYYLTSVKRPDLVIVNKKENLSNCGLCRSGWPQGITEGRRRET